MFGQKTPAKTPAKNIDSTDSRKLKDEKHKLAAPDAAKPLAKTPRHRSPAATKSFATKTPGPSRSLPEFSLPASRHMDRPRGSESDPTSLLISRNINLEGKITSCEKLIVEGIVDASLPNAKVIEIAPSGHFTGKANVDEADISGRFDGELIASERLIVRAGGHINGKIRYGRIVIESGGEVVGDMEALEDTNN
ncbi:MAG: hypothetical protein CMF69_05030 [Magnetovibrio sp.]|nr:hypothetical protein [Magnetovibrio sp.]